MNGDMRLSDLDQWCAWKYVPRKTGKPQKIPIDPKTGRYAVTTDPTTWGSLAQARERQQRYGLDGIGIVLTEHDPFLAIDLDNCVTNDGLTPLAAEALERLNTYAEITPSGTGLHLWLKSGVRIRLNRHDVGIELYNHEQFITWTGKRHPKAPNQIVPGEIDWLVTRYGNPEPQPPQAKHRSFQRPPADDSVLWQRIFKHDRTGRAAALFAGDLSVVSGDESKAEILLANTLALWCKCDPAHMRRMMLQSGIRRDKWEKTKGNGDWLDYQIANAIAYRQAR